MALACAPTAGGTGVAPGQHRAAEAAAVKVRHAAWHGYRSRVVLWAQ